MHELLNDRLTSQDLMIFRRLALRPQADKGYDIAYAMRLGDIRDELNMKRANVQRAAGYSPAARVRAEVDYISQVH